MGGLIEMKTLFHRFVYGAGILALTLSLFSIDVTKAQSVGDFYKGSTLTILLGHPPGGSYDLYAQLAARHLGKHIPGNPNVIVQHRPGGGGSKATVFLFKKAPTDGSMIAILPETLAHTQLLDPKRGRWDMSKVKYIGSFAYANPAFGIRQDAPATKLEDMKSKIINVGCTGRTSQSSQMPLAIKNLTDVKFNLICGYRGSGPYMLALERGEVDLISMNWATWRAKRADDLKSGKYKIILQAGLERSPDLPDVPLIQEALGDSNAKKVFTFISSGAPIGRALMGAPGMPEDRVTALRAAFDKMVKDPAFMEDSKKRKALLVTKPGKELDKYNMAILNTPKETVELASKAMTGYKANCEKNCSKKKKKK